MRFEPHLHIAYIMRKLELCMHVPDGASHDLQTGTPELLPALASVQYGSAPCKPGEAATSQGSASNLVMYNCPEAYSAHLASKA